MLTKQKHTFYRPFLVLMIFSFLFLCAMQNLAFASSHSQNADTLIKDSVESLNDGEFAGGVELLEPSKLADPAEVAGKENYEKLKEAAKRGEADAQHMLGLLYRAGDGVKQNYTKAKEYLEQAGKQGHAEAQYALGVLYKAGDGAKQDYEKAKEYFEQAAKQGHVKAQYALGVLYKAGDGVKQNYGKAKEYFEQAAKQGHVKAKKMLDDMK